MERNSLPIVPVQHVNERFYPGMFGDFEETVTSHIAKLKAQDGWKSAEKARFFEYLLTKVDHERYRQLRDDYLSPPKIVSSALKYLDPVSWFEQKFDFVFRLELHEKSPMRILDIGTGPGHFLVIAEFYGHKVIGNEIPDHLNPEGQTHLYNALGDIYGTERIKYRITAFESLDALGGPYDLVTAFSAAFNLALRGGLWDRAAWDFFLASMRRQLLTEEGAFCLMMVKQKSEDEIWDYLASLADWSEKRELLLFMPASALPTELPEPSPMAVAAD